MKRKKLLFRESNVALYRLLTILAFFIGPILLIFAPLPGFLLLDGKHLNAKIFAISFFIFLSFIESFVYWSFWSRRELLYLSYIQGKYVALSRHLVHFSTTRIFFLFFVFSVFFKVPVSINSIFYVLGCYFLLFLTFIVCYEIKVQFVEKQLKSLSILTFIKLATLPLINGVKTRGVFLTIILSISLLFQYSSIEFKSLHYFLTIFLFIIFFVFYSIYKIVDLNIQKQSTFLKYISLNFYFLYKNLIKIMLALLFLLSVLLNFHTAIGNID